MDSKIYDAVYELQNVVYNAAYALVQEKEYRSYGVSIGDDVTNTLADFLTDLAKNEELTAKLAKKAFRKIDTTEKEREKQRKADKVRDMKLWRVTKGRIPCLCECGNYVIRTQDEILAGKGTVICKDCGDKMDSSQVMQVFDNKDIYKICGVQ